MKILASNRDLYDYLVLLASKLGERGFVELSRHVRSASRQAAATSTEFLGESRIALRKVLEDERVTVTEDERDRLRSVLAQLDEALDRRPPRSVQ
jgi:hypothetical protein